MADPEDFAECRGLTDRQMAAIKLSREKGLEIARDIPQIVEEYRAGSTIREILEGHGIMEAYKLSKNVAITALSNAMRHLIPEEELSELGKKHHSEYARKMFEGGRGLFSLTQEQMKDACSRGGRKARENAAGIFSLTREQRADTARRVWQKAYENGTGIHAQTPEEKAEAGRRGGQRTYEEGTGAHGLSHEEKVEVGRRGGRNAALAKGLTPWSDDETEYFKALCENPRYQHSAGSNKGRPDYDSIANDLYIWLGTERIPGALRYRWHKMKKMDKGVPA